MPLILLCEEFSSFFNPCILCNADTMGWRRPVGCSRQHVLLWKPISLGSPGKRGGNLPKETSRAGIPALGAAAPTLVGWGTFPCRVSARGEGSLLCGGEGGRCAGTRTRTWVPPGRCGRPSRLQLDPAYLLLGPEASLCFPLPVLLSTPHVSCAEPPV